MKYRPNQIELSKPPLYKGIYKTYKIYRGMTIPSPVGPFLRGANR